MSPPTAVDEALALVHQGWDQLKLQRPLAAWASWQRALRLSPEDPAALEALDLLANAADLPMAARAVYRFRPPKGEDRRARWDDRLRGRDLGELPVAAETFRELVEADHDDDAALYNRALCLAWMGANVQAIAALDGVVGLEASTSFDAAVEAWTLAEVLRQGAGAEHLADDLSLALHVAWQAEDGEPAALGLLRPIEPPIDPELGKVRFKEVHAYEWLDRPMPEPAGRLALADLPRVLAGVIQTPRSLRLASPVAEGLLMAQERIVLAIGDRPMRVEATPLPLSMLDAALWTFRLPAGLDDDSRRRLSRAAVERYYEDEWIHIPRHGLDDLSPLQAGEAASAGLAVDAARLAAVIRVREQLGARPKTAALYGGYPFDRLRRRVGLEPIDPAAVDPLDESCMSPADLDRLDLASLDDSRLADARRSAEGLRDPSRTDRFGAEMARRGLRTTGPDEPERSAR